MTTEGMTLCSNGQAVTCHHEAMNVGDRVVFLDDEPELDLPAGTLVTVIAVRVPGDIEFQVADGRSFTTHESSLGPAPDA